MPQIRLRTLARLLTALVVFPVVAAAQGRNVAGVYTTSVSSPQGAVKAVITVKRDAGTLSGTLAAEGFPTMPLATIVPSDTGIVMQAETPDGPVPILVKVGAGGKVTGTLTYQGMPMPLEGTFVPEGVGASVEAAGTYTMKTTQPLMGAAEFDVLCTVTKAPGGAYTGSCENSDNGAVPVSSVSSAGNVVTLSGDTPVGPFKLVLTITGGTAEGTITVGNEVAKLKGTYVAK